MLDPLAVSQPPILKEEQEQPTEQKVTGQETWLLRAAGLAEAAASSQLLLLAEFYEHRLRGFIPGSCDALKRGYTSLGLKEVTLALLSQPPILKKEQEQPTEQKLTRQETWLLRAVGLVGAIVGSQLVLLAELYGNWLGGFILGSFDALKRDYTAYCKEEEALGREPENGLLNPFVPCKDWVPQWLLSTCKKIPLSEVQEVKDQLSELFSKAGKERSKIVAAARVEQAYVWYERIRMRERLKESGYTKPIYVLLGGDVPLFKQTVQNFQPGFLNWTGTLIYSVAGGVFAVGAAYMATHTARWLHEALLVQPKKKPNQQGQRTALRGSSSPC